MNVYDASGARRLDRRLLPCRSGWPGYRRRAGGQPERPRALLGAGNNIAVIDTTNPRVLSRIPVGDGTVTALAISPDNARLYIGVKRANSDGDLQVRDITTGAVLSTRPIGGTLLSWDGYGLAISDSGTWTVIAGGMDDTVSFTPTNDPNAPVSVADGGGGYIPTITITHGTAWIGSTGQIICADPSTGHVRARGALHDHSSPGEFTSAVYLDGHVYALYLDGSDRHGLVRLTPPRACS